MAECVLRVLLGFSVGVLRTLDAIVDAYLAELNAALGGLLALSAKLNVALIPVNLALGLANAALEQLQSLAGLLPQSALQQCNELGEIFAQMNDGLADASADLNDLRLDATRQLSALDEVDAKIAETQAAIEQLNLLKPVIAAAIAAGGNGTN